MPVSSYARDKILDHVFLGTAFTQPAGCYVKLHLADPGVNCTANPAVNTTRAQVTTFAASAAGSKASSAAAQWTLVAATETYSHASLWDASVAGNPLWYGPLTAPVPVSINGTFTITTGQLAATLT